MKDIFSPAYGSTKALAVTTTTGRVELGSTECDTLLITNEGTATAYVELGDATVVATTADLPILSGGVMTISRSSATQTHVAAITGASTAALKFTSGYGV